MVQMDVCTSMFPRQHSFQSCFHNGGKANPRQSLDKYFRQHSMFRSTNDCPNNMSAPVIDRLSDCSFEDCDDELLRPECVSNVKSSQTDFSTNGNVPPQCLVEYDPLLSLSKENQDTKCEVNIPGISTMTPEVEDAHFAVELCEDDECVLVNLNNDSIDDRSEGSPYTDTDLQEELLSSEGSLNESGETLTQDIAKHSKVSDFLHSKIDRLSEKVTSMFKTNVTLLQDNAFAYHRRTNDSDDSSDDDDDEAFVKVPKNVLKYMQFSNSCTDVRSEGATSVVYRRWSDGLRDQAAKRKERNKEHSSPYTLVTSFTPSRQPISNILPNNDGSMWITFQNSNIVKLYDYHGNAIDSVDVKMEIDDIARSSDGTLYISCPTARCIQVLSKTMQLYTLLVTPTFVRGIAFSPVGDCLIACMVPNLTNQTKPEASDSHGACVIRCSINKHCLACPKSTESGRSRTSRSKVTGHSLVNSGGKCSKCICSQDVYCVKWSKLTQEDTFKYPFRVAVHSNGDIAVSDHGNKYVFLFSDKGSLLGSFNQSNLRILTNHALTYDVNSDLLIVQSGQRNILRIRRHVEGSTTITKSTLMELESQRVTAAAMDSSGVLLVVTGLTLIKVLTKTDSAPLR